VLVQLGLLAPDGLPVVGADSARALRQPTSPPTNRLMQCSHAG